MIDHDDIAEIFEEAQEKGREWLDGARVFRRASALKPAETKSGHWRRQEAAQRRHDYIVKRLYQGATADVIATEVGLHPVYVRQIGNRRGFYERPMPPVGRDDSIARSLRRGERARDVGRKHDVCEDVVLKTAARLGVHLRPVWSRREDEVLRRNLPRGIAAAALATGRSYHAVRQRAKALGLTKPPSARWRPQSADDALALARLDVAERRRALARAEARLARLERGGA